MATEGDVPPLEDMSELLKQLQRIQHEPPSKSRTQQLCAAAQQNKGSAVSDERRTTSDETLTTVLKSNAQNLPDRKCGEGLGDCGSSAAPLSPSQRDGSIAAATVVADKAAKQANFAGLKKGFLFEDTDSVAGKRRPAATTTAKGCVVSAASSSTSLSVGAKAAEETLTYVQVNKTAAEKRFEIPEVQAAMKANETLLKNKDQWLTEELFQKIQQNEKLTRQICDPKFAQAIAEFQTNPQAAMIRYHSNPEVQEFFKSFCGILGEHFSQLTDKPQPSPPSSGQRQAMTMGAAKTLLSGSMKDSQVSSSSSVPSGTSRVPMSSSASTAAAEEEDRKMKEILANAEIKQILLDPAVQDLFHSLKHNPEKAQKLLQQGGTQFQGKVRKLVDAGLLAFQR